jgi:hypothetical protein
MDGRKSPGAATGRAGNFPENGKTTAESRVLKGSTQNRGKKFAVAGGADKV